MVIIISTGVGGLVVGGIIIFYAIKYWQNIRLIIADVTHCFGFLGKKVKKFSIVNELEGSINNISEEINRFMPETLLPKCKIRWVDLNDEKSTLIENEAIVCLSFDKYDHDQNFYNALQSFIKTGLLNKAKPFLQQNTSKAIDFLTIKMILIEKRPRILSKFNENYSLQNKPFKERYCVLETIADNGYYESVFLPEINLFGEKVFTKTPDKKIEQESDNFVDWLYKLAIRERGEMSALSFDDNTIKVGIIFVADDQIYDQYGLEAYRRRAYWYAANGYPCVYLFASGLYKSRVAHQIADGLIKSEHFEKLNNKTDIIRYDKDGNSHKVTCICLKINTDIIKFDFWNQIKQAKNEEKTITAEIEVGEDNKFQVNYLGKKGIVNIDELSRITLNDIDIYRYFKSHDILSLRIVDLNEAEDTVIFSNRNTETDPANNIEANLDSTMIFVVQKIIINKMGSEAGLIIYNEQKNIYGFVPRSMAIFGRFTKLSQKYHIGENVEVQIEKYDPERNSYICRICNLEDPWAKIPSETIAPNRIVKGEIVEIGFSHIICSLAEGIEGRIAVTDLSWDSIDVNRSLLKNYSIGQTIEAKIFEIDYKNRIIYLSVKDLRKNPTVDFFEENKNTIIKGTIIEIKSHGIVLSLRPNIKGFVPKSEICWFYIQNILSRHSIGETVDVKMIAYDSEHKNISCSIRANQLNDFEKIASRKSQGDIVTGKILRFLEDKAEVKIEIDSFCTYGFVHKSQISHIIFISDGLGSKILVPGSSYKFVILAVNTEFKTFALSRKAYYEKVINNIQYGNEYTVNIVTMSSMTYVFNEDVEGILIGNLPSPSNQAIVIPAKIDRNRNRIEMTLSTTP